MIQMSELERPRKMELLHTTKSELGRQMRENSLTIEEIVFLAASNKLTASDIRLYSPTTCDKIVNLLLRHPIRVSRGSKPQPKQDELGSRGTAEETIRQVVA